MLYEKIKLEEGERIITTVRKHWWILFTQTLGVILMAILPIVIFDIITSNEIFSSIISTDTLNEFAPHFMFFYSAWLLFLWIVLFNFWTDQYLDLWTITTRRLIVIDQMGLFRRNIGSFRLERLQDMNIEIHGIIATFLKYGTIEAQTAGHGEVEFRMRFMPAPRDVKAIIIKAADELIATRAGTIRNIEQDGV